MYFPCFTSNKVASTQYRYFLEIKERNYKYDNRLVSGIFTLLYINLQTQHSLTFVSLEKEMCFACILMRCSLLNKNNDKNRNYDFVYSVKNEVGFLFFSSIKGLPYITGIFSNSAIIYYSLFRILQSFPNFLCAHVAALKPIPPDTMR